MSSTSLLNTKCSICGAPLVFPAGMDEVFCEFCLRPNARPKSEANETTLMKYANERRNLGEFDEAAVSYRKVLQRTIDEHEARWGLLLCKYGVMYVEDAASGERLITCRRAVRTLMRAEPDFRICCEQEGKAVRASYEKDAAYIDAVQAEIRRIRAQKQPYDVFICYKETAPGGGRTRDSVLAQQIYSRMKARGFRMFYAPESLKLKSGANYEAAIFAALTDARVMLALGTKREYYESTWVRSEWKRFLEMIDAGEDKLLVPMYRDLDPAVDLPVEFRMRYLQAMNMADMGFLYDLEALLEKVIPRENATPEPVKQAKSVEHQLEDARYLLETGRFEEADAAFAEVLSADDRCAGAILGRFMARHKIRYEENLPACDVELKWDPDFRRALRSASGEEKACWQTYIDEQAQRLKRKAEEARLKKEKEAREAAEHSPIAKQPANEAAKKTGPAGSSEKGAAGLTGQTQEQSVRARAKQGDANAQNSLGGLYESGHSVGQNYVEAAKWYRKAAEQGNADAQKNLGVLYHTGHGVGQDYAEAAKWYRRAAEQGHAGAQNNLGLLYKKGHGVRQDYTEAAKWYRKAAEQGNVVAQNNLGLLYKKGQGVRQDYAEAAKWFRKAAEQGLAVAQGNLDRLNRSR